MQPADVPAVSRMEADTFSSPWSERTFRQLQSRPESTEVWVAETAEGVAGYAVMWCAADQAELANLAVRPDLRRHGIGAALLDRVLERCQALGATALFLEVRRSNQPAHALYLQRGFQSMGVRKNYYSDPREDAEVMMLSFAADAQAPDAQAPDAQAPDAQAPDAQAPDA